MATAEMHLAFSSLANALKTTSTPPMLGINSPVSYLSPQQYYPLMPSPYSMMSQGGMPFFSHSTEPSPFDSSTSSTVGSPTLRSPERSSPERERPEKVLAHRRSFGAMEDAAAAIAMLAQAATTSSALPVATPSLIARSTVASNPSPIVSLVKINGNEREDVVRRWVCDHCPKTFSRKDHLMSHTRIHTGEKPFSCDLCGRGFTQVSHLRLHVRRHKGEKPFACRVDSCDFSFTTKGELNSHMRTHTNQKGRRGERREQAGTDEGSADWSSQ